MRSLPGLFVGALYFASAINGQSLIPASSGNQWKLTSIYTPSPITFSVISSRPYGSQTVTELSQVYPWATYSFLISENASGVLMEGLVLNGNTYWLPEPFPLFRTNATPGESWNTPVGPISLISKQSTVTSGGVTYTGVYRYSVGSASQIWQLKPGLGVVSYIVDGVEFKLSSSVSNPAQVTTPALQAKPCPKPGVTSIPEDASLTGTERENALQFALQMGSRNLIVGASWAELEPTQGSYSLARIKDEFRIATKYGLATVFTLRVPQTATAAMPTYLAGKSLNDPTVKTRLNALLTKIAPLLPPQVKWMNIGYEVDTFTFTNPTQLPAYLAMFDAAKSTMKSLNPSLSVGQVFSFDASRTSDEMFRQISSRGDHVAFTYYAISGSFEPRAATAPAKDIPLMIAMAQQKPVLLLELGYSTAKASPAAQAEFFDNALNTLRQSGGSVPFFSTWSYRDIPSKYSSTIATQFGQTDPAFSPFILSIGLIDGAGVPKPSWYVVDSNLKAFSAGSCTGL